MEPVAFFEVRLTGCHPTEAQHDIEIYGSNQFYLGRNRALCERTWPDPTISNKHLKIHCVLYEQDGTTGIPPLVYATDVSTNGTYLKKSNTERTSSQGQGIRMGRKSGSFLLDEGDELRISDSVTLIFHSLVEVRRFPLSAIQQQETKSFASRYLVTGRMLGKGAFGEVMIAIKQETQHQLVCKIIDLGRLYKKQPTSLRPAVCGYVQSHEHGAKNARQRWPTYIVKTFREVNVLRDIRHPNIIALEKVYYSSSNFYIFQDLVSGGDLFSYMEYKECKICDVEAAVIVRQILKGIEYLHERDIVHRDIKPENILVTSLDDGARIIITDFGNARFLPKKQNTSSHAKSLRQRMHSMVGTLEYTAPEVHRKNRANPEGEGYSKSVDMWSIGTIAATLLGGGPLFLDTAHPDYKTNPQDVIMGLAAECDLSVLDDEYHEAWGRVGSRAKDFVKKLLVLHEASRMTATEALNHPWFSNKYHADAFEALYERSIRDWKPCRKVFRMIEPISEEFTNTAASSQLARRFSQEVVSHFFTQPSQQVQYRQPNTELPSIAEDYEASHRDEPSQYSQPLPYNDSHGNSRYPTRPLSQNSFDNSMGQLTLDPEYVGEHSFYDPDQKVEIEGYGSGESMDEAWDELGQQGEVYNYDIRASTPEIPSESSMVCETPIREEKRRSQSSFTQECAQRRPTEQYF